MQPLTWSYLGQSVLKPISLATTSTEVTRRALRELALNTDLLLTPAFRDMNVQPGHRYFYTVTAVDRAGNESPCQRNSLRRTCRLKVRRRHDRIAAQNATGFDSQTLPSGSVIRTGIYCGSPC